MQDPYGVMGARSWGWPECGQGPHVGPPKVGLAFCPADLVRTPASAPPLGGNHCPIPASNTQPAGRRSEKAPQERQNPGAHVERLEVAGLIPDELPSLGDARAEVLLPERRIDPVQSGWRR